MPTKIGLYFGTFNPIHVGHLIIANHIVEYTDLDQIWMVVTPHNPLKKKSSLLDNHHRLEMVYLATASYDKLEACAEEFRLPQPNYTIHTLAHLQEKYPTKEFSIIMGADNLKSLHKWKNYEVLLDTYRIFVYPRISEGNVPDFLQNHLNIISVDAPIIELSASAIRHAIQSQKNIKPLLPEAVWHYVDQMNFYKKSH